MTFSRNSENSEILFFQFLSRSRASSQVSWRDQETALLSRSRLGPHPGETGRLPYPGNVREQLPSVQVAGLDWNYFDCDWICIGLSNHYKKWISIVNHKFLIDLDWIDNPRKLDWQSEEIGLSNTQHVWQTLCETLFMSKW